MLQERDAEKSIDEVPIPEPLIQQLHDVGNAARFARTYGENAMYVHEFGRWYVWTGHYWQRDICEKVRRLARKVAYEFYKLAENCNDEEMEKALLRHAKYSHGIKGIKSMLELATDEPGIATRQADLDTDPYLLAVQNGIVDLRSGERRAGARDDLITKALPVTYDADARCPRWEQFVYEIMDERAELVRFIQQFAGYSLTGDVSEQCFVILHGSGSNGKSTFLNVLERLFGPEYSRTTAPDLLLSKRADRHPTERAELKGARLVMSVETGEGRKLDENLIKMLTGGDTIKGRFMRQDFFEFQPEFKLFLATNHKPEVRGTDHAIWRRIRLIPFDVVFEDAQKDEHLLETLYGELPGILNWCIEGCLDWHQNGLEAPDEVIAATDQYRADMDTLGSFLDECCITRPGTYATKSEFYNAYRHWAMENGLEPLTKPKLSDRMQLRGFTEQRNEKARSWQGVGLLVKAPNDEERHFHDVVNG